MTEKTLTTENIKPALDALRGELAPWPVVAKKQDRLNTAQLNAANSGITSSLVAQIIANTAAIRALESAITGTGLRPIVVASLPAIGTQGILYIVPVTTYDPETDADVVNYSNEYIWIVAPDAPVTEGYYEQVGQTGIVINNGQLTITVNGTSVGTFTANQSGDTTAAITVPTNADYVDLTTNQTVAGVKTFSSTIDGTAAKAIADEDGTSIKTGYVNVAGNQTVTGQKTWSGNQFFTSPIYPKNTSYEIGNTPASNVAIPIYFADKNNVYTGYVRGVVLATGRTQSELYARNKFTNGALSPTGTDVSSTLQVEVQSNGDKTLYFDGSIRNNVLPYTTNSYSLGSSSYQWSSVYAQSYYYNGTAWGLDKSNVWTGASNTFSSILNQNINSIYSEIPSSDHFAVKGITDNNGDNVFAISFADRSSGQRDVTFRVYNTDGTQQGVGLYKNNDGSHDYKPMSSNAVNLGTSTNQWKSVYANSYYYNGVAWGLDKVNEWSETNAFTKAYSDATYSAIFGFSNLKSVHTSPLAVFFDVRGSSNYASYGAGLWAGYVTTGSVRYGHLKFVRTTDKRGETNSGTILDTNFSFIDMAFHYSMINFMESVRITNDGTENSLKPITTSVTDLGTSTNKWKTLNGINPGALSLPSSSYVTIDTTNWNLTGADNSYIPPEDGYLMCSSNTCTDVKIYDFTTRLGATSHSSTSKDNYVYIHVHKNDNCIVGFVGTSPVARFYPCLGNV